MPKGKASTTAKIVQCMKEEFMTFGYEKASLNRVSAKVGITTAGLYKHFRNKEDMFFYLVKDTLGDFARLQEESSSQMSGDVTTYSPFREEYMIPLMVKDVLMAFDDEPAGNAHAAERAKLCLLNGEEITIYYFRDGKEYTTVVSLNPDSIKSSTD